MINFPPSRARTHPHSRTASNKTNQELITPNIIYKLVPKCFFFKAIIYIFLDNWDYLQVDSRLDYITEIMLFFLGVVMVCGYVEMCPCFEKMMIKYLGIKSHNVRSLLLDDPAKRKRV